MLKQLVSSSRPTIGRLVILQILALLNRALGGENVSSIRLTSGTYTPLDVNVLGKPVLKLIGIPYARLHSAFHAPAELRADSWPAGSSHQNQWPAICIQPFIFQNSLYGNFKLPHEFNMSVSCSFISVYLPKPDRAKLRPAMVFMHGGSNAAGSGSFFDPSALAAHGDVVVAAPNYRLDVLGFLAKQSIFDGPRRGQAYAGNYGLLDQIAALKWLYENCESLGCDKNAITVLGHSAGSSDVMLLAQSPLARPYIKRIVMQSGSGLAHWAFLYERHIYDKIREASRGSIQMSNSLVDILKIGKLKHVSALNDTLRNFLSMTSCEATKKVECFKRKLKEFYLVLNEANTDATYGTLREIFDRFDLDEIAGLIGYFHKTTMDYKDAQSFSASFDSSAIESKLFVEKRRNLKPRDEDVEAFLNLTARRNFKVSVLNI